VATALSERGEFSGDEVDALLGLDPALTACPLGSRSGQANACLAMSASKADIAGVINMESPMRPKWLADGREPPPLWTHSGSINVLVIS